LPLQISLLSGLPFISFFVEAVQVKANSAFGLGNVFPIPEEHRITFVLHHFSLFVNPVPYFFSVDLQLLFESPLSVDQ
jgi:hypothetical protein